MRSTLVTLAALSVGACTAAPGTNPLGWSAADIAAEASACRAAHAQILEEARHAAKTGDLAGILAPDMNRSKDMLAGGCECQAAALARELPLTTARDAAREKEQGAVRARLALGCLDTKK